MMTSPKLTKFRAFRPLYVIPMLIVVGLMGYLIIHYNELVRSTEPFSFRKERR